VPYSVTIDPLVLAVIRSWGLPKTLTYAELVRTYRPAADVDEVGGVYFNGIRTVERKTKYALAHKLAGVMVWEVGQDSRGEHSLLRAIRRTIPAGRTRTRAGR
jgi:hypothetical protein